MHVPAHAELAAAGAAGAAGAADAPGMPRSRRLLEPNEPMGDPPGDLGRLRLVCTLLDTCGQFFDKGSAKRRLDVFLVRLMPYLFCKALISSPQP
jgi:hypothetical protein